MAGESSMVSWIAATDEAVRLAKNASETQRQIDELEDVKTNLTRLLADLSELSAGASVIRPVGWEGRTPSPDLVRDFIDATKTLGSRPLNRLVRDADHFMTEVRSALIDRWSLYAAEQIGDVSELLVLAETLAHVAGIAELSRGLKAILGQLVRVQKAVPSSQAVELLRQAKEALREVEESLQPESVRRFLSAVRHGASIELLTPDVVDWLKSHNALSSFKIVAARADGRN